MTIAGFAGYVVAILGVNGVPGGIGWPWWLAVPAALILSMIVGAVDWRARGAHRGHLHNHDHARDRRGVLLLHQRELCDLQRPHRHQRHSDAGVSGRRLARRRYPPTISSSASRSCAGSRSTYVARAPFGLALQGIRDNPRRMAALGFNVTAHRVAAYVFAALIAALGGILLVWSYGEIAPGHSQRLRRDRHLGHRCRWRDRQSNRRRSSAL